MKKLNDIATLIGHYVYKRSITGDLITDKWSRNQFRLIGFTFIDLKKWVISPEANTQENFNKIIGETLTHILENHWGNLIRTDPKKVSEGKEYWQVIAIKIFRTIVVALLPGVILLMVQNSTIAITGPDLFPIITFVLLWGITNLISLLDANIDTKIGSVKSLFEILKS